MQKIVPHLWFDKEAVEASKFYKSVFGKNSKIKNISKIYNTPSGDCDIVSFELLGYQFMSISAGPHFKFNPSISFLVACKTEREVDELWEKLSMNGKVLMELGEYPFSKHFGWTEDKYGLSWQIILDDGHYQYNQKITPSLMFVGSICGRAEEAMKFYSSIFPNSKIGGVARYPKGMEPENEGTVMHGAVILSGQEFFFIDSAQEHKFNFNEAISLMVNCKDQKEIDYFWAKLSHDPKSEQCGWLKDKFGLSWQIVPVEMEKFMSGPPEKVERVTQAFLKMKKFDLEKLKKAYEDK